MQLHTHQPLEDMIELTTLQQLGWRFRQEVANKFNCISTCTQKGLWLIIQWVLCRPCGESNICHLFKAHQLTGNQVTNTLCFMFPFASLSTAAVYKTEDEKVSQRRLSWLSPAGAQQGYCAKWGLCLLSEAGEQVSAGWWGQELSSQSIFMFISVTPQGAQTQSSPRKSLTASAQATAVAWGIMF